MAIPDREAIRAKLDSLGEIEVRRRLESGAYATNKVPIVQAWLAERPASATPASPEKAPTLSDHYFTNLKNHPLVATILVIAAVVVGIAQFTDAVSKIWTSIPNLPRTEKELPVLPGDSGWLLLGDLDASGERYIRGPLYTIEKSSYPDKSLLPRKGEQVRLTAERNVVIAGFKSTGLRSLLTPPWTLNVLTDDDYTGIKLPKDGVVEVRDVSVASSPLQPLVVWVRIALPPK